MRTSLKAGLAAIRGEEKMLAVKKLMPETLLYYRFRGTAMSYSEIIIAWRT